MRLYHYSESKFEQLTPQNGSRRHGDEHNAAKDQAGVWLTEDAVFPPSIAGWKPKYRHTVEIEKDDPLLTLDTSIADLERAYSSCFGEPLGGFKNPKRYFYTGVLNVLVAEEFISNTITIRKNKQNTSSI